MKNSSKILCTMMRNRC